MVQLKLAVLGVIGAAVSASAHLGSRGRDLGNRGDKIPKKEWTMVYNTEQTDIEAASSASCGADSLYGFGAYRGTKEGKLIFELESGGLCFSEGSCFRNDPWTCIRNQMDESLQLSEYQGFQNHSHPDHKLSKWSHFYLPYCTCDFWYGNQIWDYAVAPFGAKATEMSDTAFNFAGYKNVQFALAWLDANIDQFGELDEILLAGCSAGGFGMSAIQDKIRERYPNARVSTMTDSSFGGMDYLPLFNYVDETAAVNDPDVYPFTPEVQTAMLSSVPFPGVGRSIATVQQAVADKYPDSSFASFAFLEDPVINGKAALLETVAQNEAASRCNFVHWILDTDDEDKHCSLPDLGFWDTEMNDGTSFIEAIADLVDDDECVPSILPDLQEIADAGIQDIDVCADEPCSGSTGGSGGRRLSKVPSFNFEP